MQRTFLSLIAFASLILGAPTNEYALLYVFPRRITKPNSTLLLSNLPALRSRADGIVWYLIANSVAGSCGSGGENVITDVSGYVASSRVLYESLVRSPLILPLPPCQLCFRLSV